LSEDLPLVDIDSLALEIDSDYILSHRKGFNYLQLPGLPIKKARKMFLVGPKHVDTLS
jgi:hypothetical protein